MRNKYKVFLPVWIGVIILLFGLLGCNNATGFRIVTSSKSIDKGQSVEKAYVRVISKEGKEIKSQPLYTATCYNISKSRIYPFSAYGDVWIAIKGNCSVKLYPQNLVSVHLKQVNGVGCGVLLYDGKEMWVCKEKVGSDVSTIEFDGKTYDVERLATVLYSPKEPIVITVANDITELKATGLFSGKNYKINGDTKKMVSYVMEKAPLMVGGVSCTEYIDGSSALWKVEHDVVMFKMYKDTLCGVKDGKVVSLPKKDLVPYVSYSEEGSVLHLWNQKTINFSTFTFVIDSPHFSYFEQ